MTFSASGYTVGRHIPNGDSQEEGNMWASSPVENTTTPLGLWVMECAGTPGLVADFDL